jgi:hypothetical protein
MAQKAEEQTEYRRADLKPKVKQLEWYENPVREYWYTARSFGVNYEIRESPQGSWVLYTNGERDTAPFNRFDQANAAAQADYERRVWETLE